MDKGIKHKLSFEIHSMTKVNAIKITQYTAFICFLGT